jgi:SAM-dependent methyltransferase
MIAQGARTDKSYWADVWDGQGDLPAAFDPADTTLYNTVNRRLHDVFTEYMKDLGPGALVAEIGCAQSQFLPYFATHFGVRVAGVDYEETGCAKTRAMLDRAGVQGEVVCADMFAPPLALTGACDIVFTYGLIEHFDDTAAAVRACAAFLKPGGIMITVIPNMTGLVGWMQKMADRAVYDVHVPLDRAALRRVHADAGLTVARADYFMFVNNNVVTTHRIKSAFWHKTFRRLLSLTTKPFWIMERAGLKFPPNRMTSPYIIVIARRTNA